MDNDDKTGRGLMAAWGALCLLAGTVSTFSPPFPGWVLSLLWGLNFVTGLFLFRRVCRKRAADRILNRLVERGRDLLWAADSDMALLAVCGASEKITGRPSSELLQIPLFWLLEKADARELERLARLGSEFSMAAKLRHPSGNLRDVEVRGWPVNGSRIRREGPGFEGVILDRTEDKKAQVRFWDMEKELEQRDRLADLGRVTGSVAHDLNNILSGIATYPGVLLMDPDLDSKTRKGLQMLQKTGKKASSVVSDLLTLSRGGRSDRQLLNINTVIQRYLDAPEFERLSSTYALTPLDLDLSPDLLYVRGSYLHIEKSLANLLAFGFEQTAEGPEGELVLSTANHYTDQEMSESLVPGEYAVLRLSISCGDQLTDLPLDRIFDPFFVSRETGREGTGLEMTLVRKTIRDHGGDIRVVSVPGGTRFELFFPAVREDMDLSEQETSDLKAIMGHGETLLLVDDLASQRKIGTVILEKLGYTVHTAADGLDAVEFIRKQTVDLLILDMVMAPSISGLETYRRIKEIRPDQKALIVSGHPASEDVLKTQSLGAGGFVKKPYTVMDMGTAVKEELQN